MGVGGQRHDPAALPPGMTRYPLYRRLGRPQGRSGRVLTISPPLGFDTQTVQLVASCCTDYAIPAHDSTNTDSFYIVTGLTLKILHFPTNCIYVFCQVVMKRNRRQQQPYASIGNIVFNFIQTFALAPSTIQCILLFCIALNMIVYI
jgi:hypothetical protein